ncbi:hypothetical protein INR49_026483 [Caranx melampygus]|nr:hypothetical protein INR49_026483 [Caranx melampygus]
MGLCLGTEVTEEEKKARIHSAKIDRDLCSRERQEHSGKNLTPAGEVKRSAHAAGILMHYELNLSLFSPFLPLVSVKHIQNEYVTRDGMFCSGTDTYYFLHHLNEVLDNLLTSMKFVLHGMGILRINLANSRNKVLFPFLSHALSYLWTDQGVRAAAARGYEYELNDSALYFFENMARITSPDYIPTETDVLRVRLRTTGVIETQFKVNHLIFRMYDVGGQRTERRKWISCFEDVRAVLFVVSLSGYDMTLVEDPSMNRLQESMKLFSSICNNVFFRSTSMSLLPKLSSEAVKRNIRKTDTCESSGGVCGAPSLGDYVGADCDVDSAARFIAATFVSFNTTPSKLIYHHFTTATDTSNIQVVFQVVMDMIIKENLEAVEVLPGARWRMRAVFAGPTRTHADRQSSESRVRKTSALHWKVPVPSRSSSQLFRFGEMSFTQMACRRMETCLLVSGITLLPTASPLSISVSSDSDLRTYGDLLMPDSKPEARPTE